LGYKAVTISLTPGYHISLKKFAKEEGMTVSAWITRRIYERIEESTNEILGRGTKGATTNNSPIHPSGIS